MQKLPPRQRFQMLNQMIGRISDDQSWPDLVVDTLLREFGLPSIDYEYERWSSKVSEFARIVSSASDDVMLGIFATVMDIDDSEVQLAASSPDNYGLWSEDQIRLFISHSAVHKEFVGQVAQELAVLGVHGFVAHDTMQIERPWQNQIETALRTAEAFVGFVHKEFNNSNWCQQEVGWAKGRELPEYFIRMGDNPKGFVGSTQWPSMSTKLPKTIAMDIFAWLQRTTSLTDRILPSLIVALKNATNYISAGAAAERIVAVGMLTDKDWASLDDAYVTNVQVNGGILPMKQLQPFYEKHNRKLPDLF